MRRRPLPGLSSDHAAKQLPTQAWPKRKGPRPLPAAALDFMPALPGLGKDERNRSPVVRLQDVHGRGVTTAGTCPVFKRRVLIHDVRYDQLDTHVLEVIIRRRVARVIAHR